MALYSGSASVRLALLIIVHGAVAEALAVIALYQQHAPGSVGPIVLTGTVFLTLMAAFPPTVAFLRAKRAKRAQLRTRSATSTDGG